MVASVLRLLIFGLILVTSQGFSAEVKFFSGSNIHNKDNKSYQIKYSFPARTKVCFVLKPTPEIKRSLSTTLSRKVKGLTIVKQKYDGESASISATIAAKTHIYCLCTNECKVSVGSLGSTVVGKGKTLFIENGKLEVK